MVNYTEKIQEISARLLESCQVEMVIGFRKGSIPLMNEPVTIRDPKKVDQLIWDGNCGINLANYLPDRTEKIGIVAKGCDSRNIVTHIVENKIKREQLIIIGVPCSGMLDRKKIESATIEEVVSVSEKNQKVLIKTTQSEFDMDRDQVLQQNCTICTHRNPVIYDEIIADKVEEQSTIDRYEVVNRIETMPPDEKWRFFDTLLSPCIRCYACRNACPLCYCPTCFVDESNPQWLDKGNDEMDIKTFHFLRAYHCAGRCTDCGACERACPVGINMRLLTLKLEKDCVDQYGWQAGLSLEERPPLDTFRPEDSDEFIQ